MIIRRVVHSKAKLLVPSRSLPASLVGFRLLCFLSKTSSAIGVLLAHRLPIWQVLPSIDDQDQRPNLWAIHRHVCEEAGGMRVGAAEVDKLGSHDEGALRTVVLDKRVTRSL